MNLGTDDRLVDMTVSDLRALLLDTVRDVMEQQPTGETGELLTTEELAKLIKGVARHGSQVATPQGCRTSRRRKEAQVAARRCPALARGAAMARAPQALGDRHPLGRCKRRYRISYKDGRGHMATRARGTNVRERQAQSSARREERKSAKGLSTSIATLGPNATLASYVGRDGKRSKPWASGATSSGRCVSYVCMRFHARPTAR